MLTTVRNRGLLAVVLLALAVAACSTGAPLSTSRENAQETAAAQRGLPMRHSQLMAAPEDSISFSSPKPYRCSFSFHDFVVLDIYGMPRGDISTGQLLGVCAAQAMDSWWQEGDCRAPSGNTLDLKREEDCRRLRDWMKRFPRRDFEDFAICSQFDMSSLATCSEVDPKSPLVHRCLTFLHEVYDWVCPTNR